MNRFESTLKTIWAVVLEMMLIAVAFQALFEAVAGGRTAADSTPFAVAVAGLAIIAQRRLAVAR